MTVKLELKGTMHGVAVVDQDGDIKAIIDPGVHSIAMMRPEDAALGELFCQAPAMRNQLGLLRISLDHKTTLLESCEKAMIDRDALNYSLNAKIAELEAAYDSLKKRM